MIREQEPHKLNKNVETSCILCSDCHKILYQPTAFVALFKTGLCFQKALVHLRSASPANCHLCALFRQAVLDGALCLWREDEEFCFSKAACKSAKPTFTLKAAIDGTSLVQKFIRFSILDPFSVEVPFWGISRKNHIRHGTLATHIEHARQWIEDCKNSHTDCPSSYDTSLPTRVLEVLQGDGTPNLKLLESRGRYGCYMTLSYCWGKDQPAQLTSKNLGKYLDGIEESTLPITIQDFIGIARALNVRFVWVDAYCILQDSVEDKHKEISSMNEVYKSSFLTVIASKATCASDGFVDSRPQMWPFWDVPFGLTQGNNTVVTLQKSPWVKLDKEPISSRAWTLQERLLSPRILSFLSGQPGLEWRCDSIHESNIGPIERPYRHNSDMRLFSSILPRTPDPPAPLSQHRLCYRWAEIVQEYSRMTLTDPHDKLSAIGGIAHEFGTILGSAYYAGLWGKFILTQLLWKASGSTKASCARASQYIAPSWSWASVHGPVELCPHPYPTTEPALSIVSCEVTLRNVKNPYGSVLAGKLTVHGLLKVACVRDGKLFDIETELRLAFARLDCSLCPESTQVYCLLLRNQSSNDWETRTCGSETSEDYPDQLCALLLVEKGTETQRVFARVGFAEAFQENAWHWFEDAVREVIDII